MGFRDLFRRQGPAEAAARARLERAQTERWPLHDDQLSTLAGAVDAARLYDRRPELGRSYSQLSAEAIERGIDARQAAVQERLQGIEQGFRELRRQDPFGGQEKYSFLPEPDWPGGRPSVADLEDWAESHEQKLGRDSVELRDQLNAERLESNRQQAINDAAFQREVAEHFAGELETLDRQGPTERQWRALCATVYDAHIQQVSTRWGATEAQAQRLESLLLSVRDQALELAPHVDIPPSVLAEEALEAAQLHGRDPGSDYDPDRFAEPDWDRVRRERVGPDLADSADPAGSAAASPPALAPAGQETPDPQADRTAPEAESGADAEAPRDPSGDEVRAQAEALRQAYFHQMTLENTPAASVDDRYTYDDDVWLSDARHSDDLDRQLREHVRAHPAEFIGTKFEDDLRDLDPAPAPREPAALEAADEHLGQPESDQREHDQRERDQRECDDDEFDAPF